METESEPPVTNGLLQSACSKAAHILHDTTQQKFSVFVGERESRLDYERCKGALDLKRTMVAEIHRANELADTLVISAFEYAVEQDLKVIPSCRYVEKYLDEHPHWEYLSTATVDTQQSGRFLPVVLLLLAVVLLVGFANTTNAQSSFILWLQPITAFFVTGS